MQVSLAGIYKLESESWDVQIWLVGHLWEFI